jgi:hypothetical protein
VWPRLPHGLRPADDNHQWRYPGLQLGGVGHLRSFTSTDRTWLIVVSERGIDVSTTNAAEDIVLTLEAEYGKPLVYLEHWPSDQRSGDVGATLDQVVLDEGRPYWRRVWPLRPGDRDYAEMAAWVAGDGAPVLAALDWDGDQ